MFSSGSSSTSACTAPARYPFQYSTGCCDLLHDTSVPPVSESDDDWSLHYHLLNQALYPVSYHCRKSTIFCSHEDKREKIQALSLARDSVNEWKMNKINVRLIPDQCCLHNTLSS
jgi:hypothetical protein